MRRVLLALAILVLTVSVGAQAPTQTTRGAVPLQQTPGPVLMAEACTVELTPAGHGKWRGSFSYRANTDEDGHISKLSLWSPANDPLRAFIRLDQFESCLDRWEFAGAGQYSVTFTAGTEVDTARRWTVTVRSVSLPPPRPFRLVFPRSN